MSEGKPEPVDVTYLSADRPSISPTSINLCQTSPEKEGCGLRGRIPLSITSVKYLAEVPKTDTLKSDEQINPEPLAAFHTSALKEGLIETWDLSRVEIPGIPLWWFRCSEQKVGMPT